MMMNIYNKLHKNNKKEIIDAISNYLRPNKLLLSSIKNPIKEQVENVESPK